MKSSSTRNRDRREKVRFDRGVLGVSAGMVCMGRGPSAKMSGRGRARTRGAQGDRCGKPRRCEGNMDKQKGEGGIYVWRKRRAAAPARLLRLLLSLLRLLLVLPRLLACPSFFFGTLLRG